MNKIKRKQITDLTEKLSEIKEMLEILKADEEKYMESIPENLHLSSRYKAVETEIDNLDMALDSLEETFSYIKQATE
jgi:predicted nuclease with TOPRIM domain